MTHKLELPEGSRLALPADFSADMKDSSEITRGEKKAVENANMRAAATANTNPLISGAAVAEDWEKLKTLPDADMQPFETYQNLMVKTCLVSWSRGALPVEPEDFDAMPAEVYEALVSEANSVIFGKPLDFGPDGAADPKAQGASSNGSQPTSQATDAPSETTTPTPQ